MLSITRYNNIRVLYDINPVWLTVTSSDVSTYSGTPAEAGTGNFTKCNPPLLVQFPSIQLPESIPVAGQVSIYALAVLYLLVSMVIVCDSCFVPSIERLCQGEIIMYSEGDFEN